MVTAAVQVLRAQESALEGLLATARRLERLAGDATSPKRCPLTASLARRHVEALLATRRSLAQQIVLLGLEADAGLEVES